MRKFASAVAAAVVAVSLTGSALAQPHDNSKYVRHDEWKKGYHMPANDWGRGDHIDYNQYHLAAPPKGYEWRRIDGNFVMAATATGIVASVVAASR